jgi:ribonuclease Z
MQSMGMNRRTKKLRIYGPVGTKEKINMLMKVFESDKLSYTVEVFDIDPKNVETIYENNLYKINAMKLVHTVDCIGFSFVEKDKIRINTDYLKSIGVPVMHPELKKLALEKNIEIDGKKINYKKSTYKEFGKKVTIILDSSYDEKLVKLSKDSDLLICESTFSNKVKESAKKGGHMTSKEAAKLAKLSDSKKLLLTHFSQRYKSVDELKSEAKSIYKKEIIMAKDFMELKV